MLHTDKFKDEVQEFKLPSFKIQKNLSSTLEKHALKLAPKPFLLPSWTFAMDTHEENDWFVVGYMDGLLEIFDYSDFRNVKSIMKIKKHKFAIQDVHFMAGGNAIISSDSKGNILMYDIKQKKSIMNIKDAHDGPSVHKVIECIDGHIIATGDENGTIRIWDIKTKNRIKEVDEHADAITAFCYNADQLALYASSADGSVSQIEISTFGEEKVNAKRLAFSEYRAKLYDISKPSPKQSYTGVLDILNGEVIVTSTAKGRLNIYKYGKIYQTPNVVEVDALPIDHLIFLKENIVCTINAEGGINSFRLKKVKDAWEGNLAQHIGEHEDGVTSFALDSEGKFLITAGNDQYIRFHETRDIFGLKRDLSDDEVESEAVEDSSKEEEKGSKAANIENHMNGQDDDTISEISTSTTHSRKRVGFLDPVQQVEKRKKRKLVSKHRDFFSGLM